MSNLFKRYSSFQLIKLGINLIRTKALFRNAKIIRFPFDIRGKKYIKIDNGFTTGVGCRIEAYPINEETVLTIGKNVQMNDYVHVTAMEKVSIGDNVLMASKIYISDCSHGSYAGNKFDSSPLTTPMERKMHSKEVIIGNNVWLGEFVSVLPGVTIGSGSIIGANSVVSKNIPSNVIAVGSPAKPIKKFNFETQRWDKIVTI
ncbi:LbetaH domain-containing protein [Pedobacter jejuensis]|uniref:Acetyltransferase n=1 Tax=Pedobacter jejuensis TaxID=1268550 RepID=A0A3N0C2Y0_9SPHI|nr:DapH/DapD/GlmU-related protein [Pedobacter jejuensis]RNL56910.1 acetyltransferase [Pedobacter jejuensis]